MRFKMVNEICINYENSADRFINVKEENQHFYQLFGLQKRALSVVKYMYIIP